MPETVFISPFGSTKGLKPAYSSVDLPASSFEPVLGYCQFIAALGSGSE